MESRLTTTLERTRDARGNVPTLEQDIRKIAINTVRVYAEASRDLGSVDPFRTQL